MNYTVYDRGNPLPCEYKQLGNRLIPLLKLIMTAGEMAIFLRKTASDAYRGGGAPWDIPPLSKVSPPHYISFPPLILSKTSSQC